MESLGRGLAIVAGGSGGIGSAIVGALAGAGADVAFTYRSRRSVAEGLVEEVERLGRRASAVQVDHTDSNAVKAFADAATAEMGPLRWVVYAAGPHLPMKFVSAITPAEWKAVIDADVGGAFNLVWATLPLLKANGGGAMVAVTTAAVKKTPMRDICSAAPKAAIELLFRGVALEEGRYGVRSNCVAPGFIDAGLGGELIHRQGIEDWVDGIRRSLPLKQFGGAQDIADAVIFLLSPQSRYITGQSLAVDGGLQL